MEAIEFATFGNPAGVTTCSAAWIDWKKEELRDATILVHYRDYATCFCFHDVM